MRVGVVSVLLSRVAAPASCHAVSGDSASVRWPETGEVLRHRRRVTGSHKQARTLHVPVAEVEERIVEIRGAKVLLDTDLALLYEVPVKRLNQAVRRNRQRFPPDFLFQLSPEEWAHLRSQFVTSKIGRGGRRHPPYAFTEHGAVMAATILRSQRAVAMSILVVRAFVRLRKVLVTHEELTRRLAELEQKYDQQFGVVFQAIREILKESQPEPERRRIGFVRPGNA